MSGFVNDCNYRYQIREYKGYKDGKQILKTLWVCPIYSAWKSMKARSEPAFQSKYPSYQGVTVCDEWRVFSNFHKWATVNLFEGLEVDKDVLLPGNKVYSPETCAALPKSMNYLLNSFKSIGGTLPMGVSMTANKTNQYRAAVSSCGKRINLGVYTSKEVAHKAWQWEKANQIETMIVWYAQQPYFRTDVAEALTQRVWKLRLDHSLEIETKTL